jgi:hypothetical protein
VGKAKQQGTGNALKTGQARRQTSNKPPKRASGRKPSARRKPRPTVSPLEDAQFPPVAGIPDQPEIDEVTGDLSPDDRKAFAEVLRLLAEHLGSHAAARLWLVSPGTGFETTALDAVRMGHAKVVLGTLDSQWGPNPPYA